MRAAIRRGTGARFRRGAIGLYQAVTGRRFLDRLAELERQQWLPRDQLLGLQRTKLGHLVESAYAHVPYYRRLFDELGLRPADVAADPAAFARLPILTKDAARRHSDELRTTDPRLRPQLGAVTTSGSTGAPFQFLQDHAFRDFVTADILRHLGWAGWRLGTTHCYLWGRRSDVALQKAVRVRLMDWILNRFVTTAWDLSDERMAAFLEQVRRRRPAILFGYASSLHHFATFCRDRGAGIGYRAVFSSADTLHPVQRRIIEETFGCPVFDRYGTLENGGIGCQCEAQTGLHVSVENVYVEVLDAGGAPCPAGQPGNLVITNLNNLGMPLIRYSVADVVSWREAGECPCGRAHPMLALVEGRTVDRFWTREGRMVLYGMDKPIVEMPGVRQYQLVQRSFDSILVRVVRDPVLSAAEQATIVHGVRAYMGEHVQVEFEFPAEIPPLSSGKQRHWVCKLDEADRPAWDRAFRGVPD